MNDENRDRLHKVRPLIELLRSRCNRVYTPGECLSVDESLVLFKGRLHFRQYIKTKPARFGIKLYELCTSEGITLDFLVYCGKGMFTDDCPNSNMPTTERIPAVLMKEYLGKGHTLYTDNFYTSPSLAKFFLDNQTHLVGTVRSNRLNYPKEIIPINLDKGKACFFQQKDSKLLAIKYRSHKDKAGGKAKVVFMLTTCHQPVMEPINPGSEVNKPIAVKAYNKHMGGVDRVDQQLHSIQVLRKAYKWYRKLAFRLIMQTILNAQKVYASHTNSSMPFLTFVLEVTKLLTTHTVPVPANIRVPADENHIRLTGRHFPMVKPALPGASNKNPAKICKVCYAKGKRTSRNHPMKTTYVCADCPSMPGLHIENCFRIYHTQLNYGSNDID